MAGRRDFDACIRIDKWLWAARFYKTRSLATDAVNGGKIELNGERPKASKDVRAGDEIRIRIGPFTHVVRVLAIAERRGSAAMAAMLYRETEASLAEREKLRQQLRCAPAPVREDRRRPTKKERRALDGLIDRTRRSS